ncbi:MAG: hypothetical protein ACSLFP_02565, partial [Acidimicrobiales bacterium]
AVIARITVRPDAVAEAEPVLRGLVDATAPTRVDAIDDLDDDTPIGGRVVLPRWISLLPVAAFAASVGIFVGSVLMASPAGLGLSVALFILSCTLFLAAPFIALLASRRGPR